MAKKQELKPVITHFHADLRWDLERPVDMSFEEFEDKIAMIKQSLEALDPNAIKLYRIFE